MPKKNDKSRQINFLPSETLYHRLEVIMDAVGYKNLPQTVIAILAPATYQKSKELGIEVDSETDLNEE